MKWLGYITIHTPNQFSTFHTAKLQQFRSYTLGLRRLLTLLGGAYTVFVYTLYNLHCIWLYIQDVMVFPYNLTPTHTSCIYSMKGMPWSGTDTQPTDILKLFGWSLQLLIESSCLNTGTQLPRHLPPHGTLPNNGCLHEPFIHDSASCQLGLSWSN